MLLTDQIRAFLTEPRFAVLATTNKDGSIQQTVMWFKFENDSILMNTNNARTKFRNLNANTNVSICVADGYRYVTLQGTATLNEDRASSQRDFKRIGRQYVTEEEWDSTYRERAENSHRVTISVPIEHVITHGV